MAEQHTYFNVKYFFIVLQIAKGLKLTFDTTFSPNTG